MKIGSLIMIFSIFCELATAADSAVKGKTYFDDCERGWHWYENMTIPEEKPKILSKQTESPLERLKQYQQRLETAKAEAVLNPTPQNVLNYQKLQYELMEQSEKFAKVWMRNVYLHPEIDHTRRVPVSQKTRHLYLRRQEEEGIRKISALSKKYGLFLFFRNDCPYCEEFSPIVKRFSKKYGWEVLAVSERGEQSKEFKRSLRDNGLAEAWGVKIYPSLFAVDPRGGRVIPVAVGMISVEEMEERILALAEEKEERHE